MHVDEEGFVLVGSEHSECWYIGAADQIHHFGFLPWPLTDTYCEGPCEEISLFQVFSIL